MGRKLSRSLAAYGAVFDSLLPSDERRRKFQTANGGAKGRLVFAERERGGCSRGEKKKESCDDLLHVRGTRRSPTKQRTHVELLDCAAGIP